MTSKVVSKFYVYLLALVSLALVLCLNPTLISQTTLPQILAYPPAALPHMHFGYNETFADSLWIRTIQDFDLCEQAAGVPLQTIDDPLNTKAPLGKARCENAWVFQMIDAITTLAPRFKTAFVSGAMFLSIYVEDREGALHIFEKAIEQFPDDWQIRYRLGYHYLYEMRDLENAAVQINEAAKLGGPPWLYALAGRIYSKVGQAELGISILEDALAKNPDGPGSERIRYRLEILKKEVAKARE